MFFDVTGKRHLTHGPGLAEVWVAMKFWLQVVLAFVVGLVIGNVLLHVWDVVVGLDPFDVRWGRW